MARAKRSGDLIRRALWVLGGVAALAFAIEGGEYGTSDLLRQRVDRREIVATIDSLDRIVDSLRAYQRSVLRDPAVQERIAREQFGMVRGEKELLYWITDTTR